MEVTFSHLAIYKHHNGKLILPSVINKSNTSTPPIGIDNIKSHILFEDIAVQFFTLSTLQFPLEVCGQEDQCLSPQAWPFVEQNG